jgi:hypothetical protein
MIILFSLIMWLFLFKVVINFIESLNLLKLISGN